MTASRVHENEEASELSERKFDRRRFLKGSLLLGSLALFVGGGYVVEDKLSDKPKPKDPVLSFFSQPDLHPAKLTPTVLAAMAPGLLFLAPSSGPVQTGPLISDNDGNPIWFYPISTGDVATNFQVSRYLGEPVLAWWQGKVVHGHGQGRCMIFDSSYRQVASVQAGNGKEADLHDFMLLPSGNAIVTYYEPIPADLSSVGGPSNGYIFNSGFQVIEVATGQVRFEWSAIDHIGLTESYNPLSTAGSLSNPWDYFHINSVDIDGAGDYLISARHTWALYKLDGKTGSVKWRLNGKLSDFAVAQDAQFSWQHDARFQPDGRLSIFDDGAGTYKTEKRSRGIIVNVNDTAKTVELDRAYVLPGDVLSSSQGSVRILSNSNVFVGWGSSPYLSEYSKEGRMLFSMEYPNGVQSYRAFRFQWTGHPATKPAVAVFRRNDGSFDVAASWNGATGVSSWRLLGGPSTDPTVPFAEIQRSGFETVAHSVRPPNGTVAVAVAALDSLGRELGRSSSVSI